VGVVTVVVVVGVVVVVVGGALCGFVGRCCHCGALCGWVGGADPLMGVHPMGVLKHHRRHRGI
jgi:hypothetical protein